MKINWKARIKNPVFWTTIIPAITGMVYTILGALGVIPALTENMVLNIMTVVITALSALGVLVDPTTKGLNDSYMAMTYSAPRADDIEEEEGL